MKEYLSIGDMAAIFGMDVQLLRHYDAKGLLVPAIRNPENGRRYYWFDQIYPLATIRYLRKLGYSLKGIEEFMQARDLTTTIETLQAQSDMLRRQYEELLQTDSIIQKKLEFIRQQRDLYETGKTRYQEYPVRNYIMIGEEYNLFTHNLFYFYPTVGFYTGNKGRFGAYLFEDNKNVDVAQQYSLEIEHIPAGTYFCGYHFGPYRSIGESIDKLTRQAEGKELDSTIITINIIDQFVESHPDNYVTELQVRVLET